MHRTPLLLVAISACTPFAEDGIEVDPGDGGPASAPSGDFSASEASADATDATDGSTPARCDVDASFGAPTLMPPLATTIVGDVRFSADALTVYFASSISAVSAPELFVATRTNPAAPFDSAAPLAGAGIDTSDGESDPTVSGDGLTLVFARSDGPSLLQHLHYATRATPAVPFAYVGLVPNVNALATVDQQPYLRPDGQALYFASSRVAANFADVYRASWNGTSFDSPVPVTELDTPDNDYFPVITADDKTIYFASGRSDPTALGGDDIWMANRSDPSGPFSPPVDVTVVNSDGAEAPTYVTPDGCALYFASTRGRTLGQMYIATKPSL